MSRSRKAAAEWVVRLSAPDADETVWSSFEAWLQAAPANRPAYDECLTTWLELDALAESLATSDGIMTTTAPVSRPKGLMASPSTWWGAAAACAFTAIAVSSALYLRPTETGAGAPAVYATATGQQRAVQLADGTRIDLGGASRIEVRFKGGRRDVALTRGEAAFTVTHDANHPFTVAVGDRLVEDIGTEFDIRRGSGDVSITVRRGKVQVSPASGAAGDIVSVSPGERLRHTDGAEASVVESLNADDAFAWKSGRLIYRNQPLRDVAEDLNRYFPQPVKLEGVRTAELHFTGVLAIDSEAPTLRRLTALLPVSAKTINGAIILRSRDDAR